MSDGDVIQRKYHHDLGEQRLILSAMVIAVMIPLSNLTDQPYPTSDKPA